MKEGYVHPTPAIFTIRNTVFLAVFQTGVITLGVLMSGTNQKVMAQALEANPTSGLIPLLAGHGIWLLLLPLIWVITALWVREREDVSARTKLAAFLSGAILILLLGALFWGAVSQSWGQVDWGFGSGNNPGGE